MRRIIQVVLGGVLCAVAVSAGDAAREVREETETLIISGRGWTLQPLANGKQAFSNRPYVWADLPRDTSAWRYTQTAGGEPAIVKVEARRTTTVYMACDIADPDARLDGWAPVSGITFRYTDGGRTQMHVYERQLQTGERVRVPQGSWTGGLLLLGMAFNGVGTFERMAYNHPGLKVDLGVGLWAWPLPMDVDDDGDLDMVVACPDKPYNGVYVFENLSGRTSPRKWMFGLDAAARMPVFRQTRRLSRAPSNMQVSFVDGVPHVLSPARTYPAFKQLGAAQEVKIEGANIKSNIHTNRVRANLWRVVDYDGDGAQDLIVGVGDWSEYGWDNAYNADGVWTNGPLRGLVYWLRNRGTTKQPDYAPATLIMAAGRPLEVYGCPSPNFADWDGDGDLDVICGEFLDGFTYFENIGTRQQPEYAAGRRLMGADRKPLVMDLEMITPTAIDWDGDGDLDLICGDEDGRVAFIENTGRFCAGRMPIFRQPRYFQQEAQYLKFGALATPCGCDWDGDGDWDLICGNTAGYISFLENLSGPGVEQPKWAAPKLLEADGKVIRIMAGPNGSIQGPAEAKWGYTVQTVCDWDGDGRLDIVANSILGDVHWYRNIGSRNKPRLAAAQPIEVEWEGTPPALDWGWMRPSGKALLTQWRTTPVTVDWNQDGLIDLVMLDQEGYLAFFERELRHGQRFLRHPKRIFCDEKGELLRFNVKRAGHSGRRKISIVDWDGDGRLDILINSRNAEWWRQVDARDGRFYFRNMGDLHMRNIASHSTNPTVVDFDGNGIPDLVCGAEDGHFYYLRNPRASEGSR
ncbi:MAG TPA: VCBS repeat-containing protein [Kiritimatiellia bacterium]|nr:VCBS repeat-containing protein [Kiritimatiellia bacterium]HRU71531.1 VCBS repeat-containing protein [Kiritimatiellia bacterium]